MKLIHDHFDGSAHCVECKGPCQLTGAERIATELARWLCERYAINGWKELCVLERDTLEEAGVNPANFMKRAIETTPRGGHHLDPIRQGSSA